MNFDSRSTEVLFSGIADDHMYPLVWNKFNEKTQRQLAEI